MDLKQQLILDMKIAMKARDKNTLKTVRAIIGAVKQFEIDKKISVDDKQVVRIITKMIKQRKDSITQFLAAKRDDLVKIEQNELEVITKYMPDQLNEKEITSIIYTTIVELGASNMADMGKVMAVLKNKLEGQADMAIVNQILCKKLG